MYHFSTNLLVLSIIENYICSSAEMSNGAV